MPGFILHLTAGAMLVDESDNNPIFYYEEDRNTFLTGCIIPDVSKRKWMSHFRNEEQKGKIMQVPDLSLFDEMYGDRIDEPLFLGYLFHLYIDYRFFTEYVPRVASFISALIFMISFLLLTLWNADDEIIDHSIMCVSPNKGFNLGGLKSSYVIIKNPEIREKLLTYLQRVYVTSPHVFAVPAIIAAYNESEEWLDQLTDYIGDNFTVLYEWFEKHMPKAKVMKADSSFLAWIDVRDIFVDEDEMKQFFIQANLTMVVGSYFVQDGYGWVRLNVGCPRSILKEALRRMEETIPVFPFKK